MSRLHVRSVLFPSLAVVSALAACVGRSSVSFQSSPTPSRLSAEPSLLVLATHTLGTTVSAAAGWAAADSVLSGWGWTTAARDTTRHTLSTGWLYANGPDFLPSSVQRCADAGTIVALRLTITARTVGDDSTEFAARGDARVPSGADGTQAGRLARQAWEDVSHALASAVRKADTRRDAAPLPVPRLTGEVAASTGGDWRLCATIKP